MKVVIDIPDELYRILKRNEADIRRSRDSLKLAVIDGTVLPKNCGDLIDRNALLNGEHFIIRGNATVGDKDFGVQEIDVFSRSAIEDAPTIIEADKDSRE